MNKKYKVIIGNILSILIILLAVVYIFRDVIFNRMIIFGSDMMPAHYPQHIISGEEFRRFNIPLWNPYLGLGFPSHAEGLIGTFHFINLLCYYFFSLGAATTISLILTVFFCCVFTYLYARQIGMGYSASIFCAFSFAFNGGYMGHISGNSPFVISFMFLPLIFYLVERMLNGLNLKSIIFLSIGIALMIFSGHMQSVFMSLLAAALYITFRVFFSKEKKLLLICAFALAVILSFGLSAIQLIPSFELKRLSLRASPFDAGLMTSGSMEISWLKYYLNPTKAAPFYMGIIPFVLFPISIFRIKRDKHILPYVLILIIFVILAFGRHFLFLYKGILEHLPGFTSFRYCHRYISIANFFIVLLAGKGLSFIIDKISRIQISLKYLVIIGIPLWVFIDLQDANRITTSGPPNSYVDYNKIKNDDYLSIEGGALLTFLRGLQKKNNLMRVASDFWHPDYYGHLPENILAQFKIPDFCINGGVYSGLNINRIEQLAQMVFQHGHYRILDVLGINYLISYYEVPPPGNWKLVFKGVDHSFNRITEVWFNKDCEIFVFENKNALPRVFMVSNVDCSSNFGFITPGSDIKDMVYIEEPFDVERLRGGSPLNYNIEVTEYLPKRVVLKTSQDRDAFLVMSDTYYPGWNAYIDKRQTKIYLANGVCRAIFVPKGEHIIEFRYVPFSFRVGSYITLASIFMILLCIRK